MRAARSQCSGAGAGEVKTEAAGRPAYRGVGRTRAGQLRKNADCQGLARQVRAEGASLVRRHPGDADRWGHRHNADYTHEAAHRAAG
ncbi:hypothetical protein [Xenorhabdus doucetiae]|uniref:hypothetical protein n=1 Tax=Xenorhabdus doucetiae TaxID=351671 RepID=UPI0012EE34EF|nr:hypothetical protein [Xenorhabdus doucetiae]